MKEKFKENYFVRNSNINRKGYNDEIQVYESNYVDYRIKKFSVLADNIIEIFGIDTENRNNVNILDFGCATGGLLKELKDRGLINVKGTDISNWAIEYGKDTFGLEDELEFYNRNLLCESFDYMIMLDVLEHLPDYELETILKLAKRGLKKKLLVRIPVSWKEGGDFVLEVSKNDRTHIQIHSRDWWVDKIESFGFVYLYDVSMQAIFSSPGVFCGLFEIKIGDV